MMQPVYFPFTYISETVAAGLSAFFQKTAVYLPSSQNIPENMRQYASNEIIDLRIPLGNDEDKLETLCKYYRDWATIHEGAEISFLKTRANTIPFFEESSTLKIKADIKEKLLKPSEKMPDPLFVARLFLQTAQEFDLQQEEIGQKLQYSEKMTQDLFYTLKGEDENLFQEDLVGNKYDPGHYKAEERIKTWARLMQVDQQQNDSENASLFVTSSRSVFDYIIDKISEAERVFEIQSLPIKHNPDVDRKKWQAGLIEHLARLMGSKWPESGNTHVDLPENEECVKTASLLIYIVPGETPDRFVSRLTDDNLPEYEKTDSHIKIQNTLIGLIE